MTDMSLDDVKRNCRRSLQLVPHRHRKGNCIVRESDVSQLIAECEKNAVPDELIDTSEIPEITSLDGFYFGNMKGQI